MNETDLPTFHPMIYKHVGHYTQQAMRMAEKSLKYSRGMVEEFEEQSFIVFPDPDTDPRELHNMYMDAVIRSSMLKNYLFNASIIRSVNIGDFLSYALAARALFEKTATLRYYLNTLIQPIIDKTVESKTLLAADLFSLIDIDDRLLRGGRFDWTSFFFDRFDELQKAYEEAQKKSKGTAVPPPAIEPPPPQQINVLTCVQKWSKDQPLAGVVYELFCDMVHPNIGSTLCLAVPDSNGIAFTFPDEHDFKDYVGMTLFNKSYPLLQSLAGKEFSELIGRFILLKIKD